VKKRDTVGELAKRFAMHPTQICEWQRWLMKQARSVLEKENSKLVEGVNPTELH
jgi:hypothetical protein